MASTQDSELKHLRFVKQIAVKFLVVLSNVYEFAKQNSGVIIVYVEKAVVFFVGPVNNILKKLAQQILLFVDDKFEKYAPSLAKNLIAIFQSLIDKTIAIVEKLLTIAQPLIGGIPLVGDLAKDLITNPKDIADSIAKENPLLGTVNSVAQNLVKEVEVIGLKPALKSAYLSFNVAGLPVIAQFCYKAKKQYPQIRCLGKVFLPVVEKLSEWYNKFVKYMVKEGCELFDYLPLIPINEMKAAYKVVKVANEGLSALGDLAGGLAGLAGGGLSAVGDVAGGLAGLAGGGLSAVGDVAGGLAGMAAGGLSGVGDVAENLAAGGLSAVGDVAGGLAGMATGGLSAVGDVTENLAGGGLSAVGDVAENLAGGLAGMATGGLSGVGDVAENLASGGLSAVGDVAGGLAGMASGGLSAVGDVAENLAGGGLSAVGDVAENMAGGLAGMATGGLSGVGDVAENLAGGGLSAVGDVAGGLTGMATGGLSAIGDVAGGLAGMVTGGLPGVGDPAIGLPGLPSGLPGLPSGLPGLPGLPSGLPGLPGGGKSVVGDVAAGLPGLAGSGSSAVGDVAAGLPGGGSPAVGDVAAGGLSAVEDLAAGGLSAVGNLAGGLTGMADQMASQGSPSSSSTIHTSRKRQKLSPRKECHLLLQHIDARLDDFASKFVSIWDQMASQFAISTCHKYDSLSDEKMQEIIDELLSIGISQTDVGKALEICYKDHAKFEKYAPSLAKNLIAIFQSLIDKTIDIVEKLLTIAQPLIGGIPLVGDLAKDLITNPKDITDSIAKENFLLGAVESVAKNLIKEAQVMSLKPALKTAYLSFNIVWLPVIAQFCYKANKHYPQIRYFGKVLLPVVEKLSEWYNKFVKYMVGEGCEPFDYLPLIPINEMKEAYKVVKVANEGLSVLGDLAARLAGLAGGGLLVVEDMAAGGLSVAEDLAARGLSTVGNLAGGLAGMAAGSLSGAEDAAENLAGGLAGMAAGGLSGAEDAAKNLAGGLAGMAAGGLSGVEDAAENLVAGLAGMAAGGLSGAEDAAKNLAGGLAGMAAGGLSGVEDAAENLAAGLAGMAAGGLSDAEDTAENLAGGLVGMVAGGLSGVEDAAKNLAGGLAGMASGGLSGVEDAAENLVGGLAGMADQMASQGSTSSSSTIHTSRKRQKLSPRKESHLVLQHIDARLDDFASKFVSIWDQMASQFAISTCHKYDSLSDEKM
ncbi:hypothetical protein OSB04_018573 [Centaurea solstitialis]|uniref:Uncharacterized protein n=1 Tax=Centaurea solstitialis TaxID=347529 RepID=A0AA38TQ04_9ASTR|nr:hypothetical protein OSB04_018573 [Centaurea solstitialis]